jgi:hypothetical protein
MIHVSLNPSYKELFCLMSSESYIYDIERLFEPFSNSTSWQILIIPIWQIASQDRVKLKRANHGSLSP